MNKEAYNYKKAFDHPYLIRKIWKITLPVEVHVTRVVTMLLIYLTMYIFRDLVNTIGSIMPGLGLVIWLAFPWFLSGWIMNLEQDGKKILYFLYDYLIYLFTIKLPKKKFCQDEEVLYFEKDIKFEQCFIELESEVKEC